MAAAHQALPDWIRPRIIALILLAFQGSQAVGALVWGVAADLAGTQWALGAAAVLMGSGAVGFLRHGLYPSEWIEPDRADAIAPSLGGGVPPEAAIRVEITYVPSSGQAAAFLDAVASLRLSRLRLGAGDWELLVDPTRQGEYVVTSATNAFAGKVALVTGGASGIGAAVVRRLDAEGCALVVVADVDEHRASDVARSCRSARPEHVDVSESAGIEAALGRAVADHGRVDVVVHAAGVDDPESKAAIAMSHETRVPVDVLRGFTDASWRRLMVVNLDGTFNVLRAAARVMVPQGHGAIITVSSSAAFDTLVGYGPYAASKAGAQALSQAAAKELAAFGVRVNVVAPGPVDTPMAARTPGGLRRAMTAPGVRGYASPEEIADSICYLAGPGATNVVGAVLLSNGGRFTV